MDRIVLLIDMDCFYVQVEQKQAPEYQNHPCAVVQYKSFKGGSIIAVNYEARAYGVKRGGTHGDDARKLCPQIHLFQIPEVRGKADLTKYRDACSQIMDVLKRFATTVERASVDEAFLDVTKEIDEQMENENDVPGIGEDDLAGTYVEGLAIDGDETGVKSWLSNRFAWDKTTKRLALAALLCEKIRKAVLTETGYRCSAGIAYNKMLAKLACGMHKPNKQTLVVPQAVEQILANFPLCKVRNLGGNLGGEVTSRFQVTTMGELSKIPRENLLAEFGEKNGSRIYDMARGIDYEQVVSRQVVKSIGCGKNFRGPETLVTREKIEFWLRQMSEELEERLIRDKAENSRLAELLTVGALFAGEKTSHKSRCVRLLNYEAKHIAASAYKALSKLGHESQDGTWSPPIISLSISASKFQGDPLKQNASIKMLFEQNPAPKSDESHSDVSRPLPDESQVKSILVKPNSAKKRPSSSVSFFSSRNKQPKRDEAEEQCEVAWADDSGAAERRLARLMSPGEDETELAEDSDDDIDLETSRQQQEQKTFERVSLSVRSLINQTLEQAKGPSLEETFENTVPSMEPEKTGGFFKRKQQEREQMGSSSLENRLSSVSPVVINVDDDDEDGDRPSTSNESDSRSTASSRQTPYYVSVEAADVDLDLLKQMPPDVQREYAAALGLNLQMGMLPNKAPVMPKKPLAKVKGKAANKAKASNKLAAITIDAFFR